MAAKIRFPTVNATSPCRPIEGIIGPESVPQGPRAQETLDFRTTIANEGKTQAVITPQRAPDSKPLTCGEPFVNAGVVGRAAVPAYPTAARKAGATGTVEVKVTLDAAGTVIAAAVYKSSGNADLDASSIASARATKYRPSTFLCRPEAGAYLFEADFAGTRVP